MTRLVSALKLNRDRSSLMFWRKLAADARAAKRTAQGPARNPFWSVQAYADAMATYVSAFDHLKRGRYYKGWCALEQVELDLERVVQNDGPETVLTLAADRAQTITLWQSLFPYRVFASPGFLNQDWACSICGKRSTPIEPCGHMPGKVYDGELCSVRITKAKILEVSLVLHPVQKYSVLTPEDREHDFSLVAYVVDRLTGPFHAWTGEWTHRRHPHARFVDHALDGRCPCASSLRYQECCWGESGVRMKHFAAQIAGRQRYEEGVVGSGVKPLLPPPPVLPGLPTRRSVILGWRPKGRGGAGAPGRFTLPPAR